MTNRNTFIPPLSVAVVLELIKDNLKPGDPSLGDPFVWTQPSREDTQVYLGIAYGFLVDTTLDDWQEANVDRIDELNVLARQYKTKKVLGGIVESEVSVPWVLLETEKRILYRLVLPFLNTATDLNNFACDYLAFLANEYARNEKEHLDWQAYEIGELAGELLAQNFIPPSPIGVEEEDVFWPTNSNNKIMRELTTLSKEIPDFFFWLTGESGEVYDKQAILEVLAQIVECFFDEWQTGNLVLADTPDAPDAVKEYIRYVKLFPGLAERFTNGDESK